MNFFRAMMSSFAVAAFSTILLIALGSDISLVGETGGLVGSLAPADMVGAFRYVFGAATVMLAIAAISMIAMEERPLAGPVSRPSVIAE